MNYKILSRFPRLTVIYEVVKMTPKFYTRSWYSEINKIYYGYVCNVLWFQKFDNV